MKKSIFILAALFAATFANAQITLEHTFEGSICGMPFPAQADQSDFVVVYGDLLVFYVGEKGSGDIKIYDAKDYSYLGSAAYKDNMSTILITRNYFTTDNRAILLISETSRIETGENSERTEHMYIRDLDGNIIKDFGTGEDMNACIYQLSNGDCKLSKDSYNNDKSKTEIYSLPGNGDQAVSAPSFIPRKSSARKMVRDGQVLVETENNTYTLTGQEIK